MPCPVTSAVATTSPSDPSAASPTTSLATVFAATVENLVTSAETVSVLRETTNGELELTAEAATVGTLGVPEPTVTRMDFAAASVVAVVTPSACVKRNVPVLSVTSARDIFTPGTDSMSAVSVSLPAVSAGLFAATANFAVALQFPCDENVVVVESTTCCTGASAYPPAGTSKEKRTGAVMSPLLR